MARFIPDLEQFSFQGNRRIDDKTWERAVELNTKFPYRPAPELEYRINYSCYSEPTKSAANAPAPRSIHINSLNTEELKEFIKLNYGEDVYEYSYLPSPDSSQEKLYMLNAIYELYLLCGFIGAGRVTTYAPFSKTEYVSSNILTQIFSLLCEGVIIVRATSPNGETRVEVLNKDDGVSKFIEPGWLNRANNRGWVIESNAFNKLLNYDLLITNKCELKVDFKSHGSPTDSDGPKILLDFVDIEITRKLLDEGGKELEQARLYTLRGKTTVSYAESHAYSWDAPQRAIVSIKVKFKPHDYEYGDLIQLLTNLYKTQSDKIFYSKKIKRIW